MNVTIQIIFDLWVSCEKKIEIISLVVLSTKMSHMTWNSDPAEENRIIIFLNENFEKKYNLKEGGHFSQPCIHAPETS